MNDCLKTEGLCKRFETFSLEDVNLTLPAGYIMGLIGSNGAGKTTTISLILNKLKRDGGRITLFGRDADAEELAVKRLIGVVGDSCYFVKEWTVAACGRSLALFYDTWEQSLFEQYCRRFGLDPDKRVKELSKGMRMKLMIAGALSHETRLLLLDEPTSGLDPVSREELLEILSSYIEDGTRSVLFSTHITTDLERIADYITYLKQGRVFFSGERQELLDSYFVVKGGLGDLNPALEAKLVGIRRYSSGFEGLLPAWERGSFPALLFEPATLDDIVVFSEKIWGGFIDESSDSSRQI